MMFNLLVSLPQARPATLRVVCPLPMPSWTASSARLWRWKRRLLSQHLRTGQRSRRVWMSCVLLLPAWQRSTHWHLARPPQSKRDRRAWFLCPAAAVSCGRARVGALACGMWVCGALRAGGVPGSIRPTDPLLLAVCFAVECAAPLTGGAAVAGVVRSCVREACEECFWGR